MCCVSADLYILRVSVTIVNTHTHTHTRTHASLESAVGGGQPQVPLKHKHLASRHVNHYL